MVKKIFLYGFAFGSLMFLCNFIFFENELYKNLTQDIVVGKVLPILIEMAGIGLLIASIRKSEGGIISTGRAGFIGILGSIVMGIVASFMGFVYLNNNPHQLAAAKKSYVERSMAAYEKNKDKVTKEEFDGKIKALDFYYTPQQQTKLDLYRVLGVGLLAAGSFGLMLAREPKNA